MFLRPKVKLCQYMKENLNPQNWSFHYSTWFQIQEEFFFFNLVIPKKNHKIDGEIIVLMVNVSMEEISIYSGYIWKCIQLKQWIYKLIKSKIKFLLKPVK